MKSIISRFINFAMLFVLIISSAEIIQAQSMAERNGIQHFQQGDYHLAIDVLEEVIEDEPLRPQPYLILISSYLETRNAPEAEEISNIAMNFFPEMAAFQWLLAEALLQQQKFNEALPRYTNVAESLGKGDNLDPLQVTSDHAKRRTGQVHQALAAEAYQENRPAEAIEEMREAVKILQDSVQAHQNLAVLLMEEEQYEEVIEAVDQAREIFPDNVELLQMKASAYYQMEDQQAVLEQFAELYQMNPDDIGSGLIYAELLIADQRSNDGIEVLEELLERHPEEKRIYRMMADLNERRFNTEGKRAVLREMQKQFPDDPDILLEITETYETDEKWKDARAVYDSLSVMTGDELTYGLAAAETYEAQDSLSDAEDVYENLNQTYPENPELLYNIGQNLESQEKWHDASRVYRTLLEVSDERKTKAMIRLGISLMNSGGENEAIEYLQQAVALGTENPEAYLFLSRLEQKRSNIDKSFDLGREALQKSLQQISEQQQALEAQIQQEGIYSQMGNEEQVRDIEKLNRLSEESFEWLTKTFRQDRVEPVLEGLLEQYQTSGRLFYMTGSYFEERGNDERALELLEMAVRYIPKLAEAHLERANILEKNNLTAQAIAAYERAGSLDPENPLPYKALIRLYRKQGKLDALCDRWIVRYRAKPNNEVLHSHLVEALHKANRFKEADEILNRENSR